PRPAARRGPRRPGRGGRGARAVRRGARAARRATPRRRGGGVRALRLLGSVVKNRVGAVPRPAFCTYLVSYRCHARCGMCDSWRMKPGRELTAAEVATVFAKIGRLDVVRVTGGEPFLREDLVEVVRAIAAASDPMIVHVTTNGSFPDRVRDFVARAGR